MPKTLTTSRQNLIKSFMKTSNVSFENLLEQLSEEKINRVVDREALRAGGLEILCPPANTHSGSSCGTKSGSHSGSSADNGGGGAPLGICI